MKKTITPTNEKKIITVKRIVTQWILLIGLGLWLTIASFYLCGEATTSIGEIKFLCIKAMSFGGIWGAVMVAKKLHSKGMLPSVIDKFSEN